MDDIKRAHLIREAYQVLAALHPAYHDTEGRRTAQKVYSDTSIHGHIARMQLAAEYLFECYGSDFLTYKQPCTCLHDGESDHGTGANMIDCLVKGCDCSTPAT